MGTEVLKAIVAQFDAGELITQRDAVSHAVQESLVERASAFGLILDDISLTHLTFGREFKQAAITTAEGDAVGAQLISDALKQAGDGLIELRKIEASEEIATNLSNSRNVVYLPSGQGILMNMPVQ